MVGRLASRRFSIVTQPRSRILLALFFFSPAVLYLLLPSVVLSLHARGPAPYGLPLLRSADDFGADFYLTQIQNRLLFPSGLSMTIGLLLLISAIRRDESDRIESPQTAVRRVLSKSYMWLFAVTLVVGIVSIETNNRWISPKGNDYDAAQNVEIALARAGMSKARITNYRDPFGPLLLSLQFRLDPRLEDFRVEDIELEGLHQIPLKQHNIALFGLSLFALSYLMRQQVTCRLLAFLYWLIAVLFARRYVLPFLVDSNLPEALGAFLVICSVLAALLAARNPTKAYSAILAGFLLGLLSLAKGQFLLVAPVYILLTSLLLLREPVPPQVVLQFGSLFFAGFLIAHAPFALERASLGQGSWPSSRGPVVLAIRAGYVEMQEDDWRALLAVGGPLPVEVWGFEEDELLRRGGRGSRTSWRKAEFTDADRIAAYSGLPDDAYSYRDQGLGECVRRSSSDCQAWALNRFTSNFRQYLRLAATVYWQEFWVFEQKGRFDALLNFLTSGALHLAALLSIWRKSAMYFIVSALPLGMIKFLSLVGAPANWIRNGQMNSLLAISVLLVLISKLLDRAGSCHDDGQISKTAPALSQ